MAATKQIRRETASLRHAGYPLPRRLRHVLMNLSNVAPAQGESRCIYNHEVDCSRVDSNFIEARPQ